MITITELPATITIPDDQDHEISFEIRPASSFKAFFTIISGTPKISVNQDSLTTGSVYAADDKEIITINDGMPVHVSGENTVIRISA